MDWQRIISGHGRFPLAKMDALSISNKISIFVDRNEVERIFRPECRQKVQNIRVKKIFQLK